MSNLSLELVSLFDLDLYLIVPNVELFCDILICYVVFQFHDPKSKRSQIIVFTDTKKHTQADRDVENTP